jgi:hypothetical protein
MIKELGRVMIKIMEKADPEDDNIHLAEPYKWSKSARNFLSLTPSASAESLLGHSFLKGPPRKGELVRLIAFAPIYAKRDKLKN